MAEKRVKKRAKANHIRYRENVAWDTGKFTVDQRGQVWKDGKQSGRPLADGSIQIQVNVNRETIYTSAHRLVWHATYGPIPRGVNVRHKNGNKTDNRPENLELWTWDPALSELHGCKLITREGERGASSKLRDRDILVIRNEVSNGQSSMSELARRYGVTRAAISLIALGKSWTHIGGPIRISRSARASKTHCAHGHEFTEKNTRTRANGSRECRECERIRYLKRKGKANNG